MGNIRQKFIKRTGKALLEKDPERFKPDFEENKKELQQMITDGSLTCPSKLVRNRLSGFMVRKVKIAKGLNIKKNSEL
jgi:ribosomal protein S17E|tara:strand:+ start:1331 stop:1564 length:234 start_codon:yes stop_codon:yes gene_type:complete